MCSSCMIHTKSFIVDSAAYRRSKVHDKPATDHMQTGRKLVTVIWTQHTVFQGADFGLLMSANHRRGAGCPNRVSAAGILPRHSLTVESLSLARLCLASAGGVMRGDSGTCARLARSMALVMFSAPCSLMQRAHHCMGPLWKFWRSSCQQMQRGML